MGLGLLNFLVEGLDGTGRVRQTLLEHVEVLARERRHGLVVTSPLLRRRLVFYFVVLGYINLKLLDRRDETKTVVCCVLVTDEIRLD